MVRSSAARISDLVAKGQNLKDRFHRPAIVFAPGSAGELRGSGRSITGFHMRDALDLYRATIGHALVWPAVLALALREPCDREALFAVEIPERPVDGRAG